MFGLFKRSKLKIFKCDIVQSANVNLTAKTATFDLDFMRTVYVEADDLFDAQQKLAKRVVLTPHVYVHRISQIDKPLAIS